MKNNTKIVSENKSSKNKNNKKTPEKVKLNKKTPEKVKLKVYLMAIRRSMKEYWSFDKWNMVSQFLAQTVLVVGSFASVYVASGVLGEIINSAQQGAWSAQIIPYLALQLIFYSLTTLAQTFSSFIFELHYIRNDLHSSILLQSVRADLDISFYEDRDNQKLLNKVDMKGSYAISQLNIQTIYLYANILRFSIALVVALKVGVLVSLLLILATIPRILTEIKRSKLEWGIWATKGDEFHAHQKTINLFRDHKNLIEIKLYNLRDKLLVNFAGKNITKFGESQAKAAKSTVGIESVAHVVYEGTFLGVTLLLLKKAVEGTISIANFSFYAGVLNQFSSAMRNVSSIVSRASESILYSKDVYSVMDSASKISTPTNAAKLNPKKIPTIEFKNVSFAYKSNPKEKILENLNLTIKAGEHLALVGENGAGKTTIIKLLLRLYDVTEGQILVNGIDIKELDLDSYWSQIGVLFQEFNRYPFDIKTNIEFGRAEAKSTKQKITRAEELSNLDPVLKKLPRGINTILDNSFEEGVEPSGGQWQRVALARAFYRDSNILILDEPTAAVDANAEYEIFNNIFNHYGNKTALIISHRFSTVKRAQRIVVLQKGKIVEEGSHRELMKNSKLYSEMFTKQAEGYKD
jgi:ATP-binding cassette subfamily B protein